MSHEEFSSKPTFPTPKFGSFGEAFTEEIKNWLGADSDDESVKEDDITPESDDDEESEEGDKDKQEAEEDGEQVYGFNKKIAYDYVMAGGGSHWSNLGIEILLGEDNKAKSTNLYRETWMENIIIIIRS